MEIALGWRLVQYNGLKTYTLYTFNTSIHLFEVYISLNSNEEPLSDCRTFRLVSWAALEAFVELVNRGFCVKSRCFIFVLLPMLETRANKRECSMRIAAHGPRPEKRRLRSWSSAPIRRVLHLFTRIRVVFGFSIFILRCLKCLYFFCICFHPFVQAVCVFYFN